MSQAQVNLSELAIERSRQAGTVKPRHSRWMLRFLLPSTILLGFVSLVVAAGWQQLIPRPSVSVLPVIVKRGQTQSAGAPLFQAAGWIEPRPTAIRVAALAPGVIEELLVVEGQQVRKHEAIARLITADAELAVEQATATVAIREGELRRAEAELAAALIRLANPVHLTAALADAEAELAGATTELEKLPYLMESAEAAVVYNRRSLDGKQAAGNAIARVVVDRAVMDHAAAKASLEELEKRKPNLEREISAATKKVQALEKQLELLIDEQRQVDEARAKVQSGKALLNESKSLLKQSQLMLDRTVVRAPVAGRILRLASAPGTRVMGLIHAAGQNSSTVVEMYDPERLQVRADVRLEDVPMVTANAPVEIVTASSRTPIKGRVLRPTSSANIQKNTLEVKVELIEPPPTVRPEMLVTATFLAAETAGSKSEATNISRFYVPRSLVIGAESEAFLWVVTGESRAVQRPVSLGGTMTDGLVEITSGLDPTTRLIASDTGQLESGQLVTIAEEDAVSGIER